MEVRTQDAKICRDRCLEAMSTAEDLETAQALWRAALKYNHRDRETLTVGGSALGRAAQVVGDRSRDHK